MELTECKIDELLEQAVCRFGQRTALVYGEDTYTWEEVGILTDRMADRLEEKGVKKGEHAGIWSENSAAWIVTFLALQKLGAVPVLLNVNYKRRELEQVMRIGGVRWLCYGVARALEEDPDLITALSGRLGEELKGTADIREGTLRGMQSEAAGHPKRVPADTGCRDLACMLFTTGSTMDPKCVMHSHYSLVNDAMQTAERIRLHAEDRVCLAQPLFHIFGLVTSLLASIHCGSTICILSHFGSEDMLRCVQEHRCTILNGVPTNFIRMLSNPVINRYSTESLRLSIIGGASISESQLEYVRQAFPTVRLMRNYGLTEGCNLCNSEYTDGFGAVARSVGTPLPHVELAIRDPQSGSFLPPGESGEIVARGFNVMMGYYCAPSAKKPVPQAVDQEGWLHTGDLGVIDEKGYVSIVGRIKDIIIRGGENIAPVEIGSEILRYEPVLDALVLGVPHPVLGEEVVACLVLDSPEEYSEHELRALLGVRLARYKIPAFFLIYDGFPLKPSGKVDLLALRKDVYEKVRALHEGDERYNINPQQKR